MAIRNYITVLTLAVALSACESENKTIKPTEHVKEFSQLVTEITMKCEYDMTKSCDIICQYVHPNGLREDIPFDGTIHEDTIQIANVKKFPITLQFYFNAADAGVVSQDIELKYGFGMTVSSQEYVSKGMYDVIDSKYKEGGFSKRGIEPDSIEYYLRQKLPIEITAQIDERGEITFK